MGTKYIIEQVEENPGGNGIGCLVIIAIIIAFVIFGGKSSPSSNKNTAKDFENMKYAYVTQDLNVRSGPSSEYNIITVLKKNDKVQIVKNNTENTRNWIKIKYNDFTGYVNTGYLRK
jgi:uncharacterized protein YgiM (DUF1202 family)